MSKRLPLFPVVAMVAALVGCRDDQITAPATSVGAPSFSSSETGNGAPSGAHYTLNIIGVPKDKSPNLTGGSGHRIFVDLGKTGQAANTRINLTEGDFAVLDANGTDGVAAFRLPNPDSDGDGATSYSVYVRALGTPGGKVTTQSCYEDATGTWCAVDFDGGVDPITIERKRGGVEKFVNVSKDLLFVDFCTEWDLTGCLTVEQIPLFGNQAISYYWTYDNEGLKLAQLRFYEVPTTPVF
jgi:hypothetical protein